MPALQLLLLSLTAARLVEGQSVDAAALQSGAPAAGGQSALPSAAAAAAVPHPSPYFGHVGELWRPDGPLPDFSYAGEGSFSHGMYRHASRGGCQLTRPAGIPHAASRSRWFAHPILHSGYKFGDQEPPAPVQAPVTKGLAEFLQPGVTQTQAILNLVAWGNAQPAAAGGLAAAVQQRASLVVWVAQWQL